MGCCEQSADRYRTFRYVGVSDTAIGAFEAGDQKYLVARGVEKWIDKDVSCDDVTFVRHPGRWFWSKDTWVVTIVVSQLIRE